MMSTSTPPVASTGDDLTDTIVAAAVEIIDEDGVAGLTNRRLAERAGTTTMAIYTRFGSKDGVAHAVFDHGFQVLGRTLAQSTPTGGPHRDLVAFCRQYRQFGLERPGLYSIMFERAVNLEDGFVSGPATKAFNALSERIASVTQEEADSPSTRASTFGLWALCHGLVNLELTGTGSTQQSDTSAALFDHAIETHVAGLASNGVSSSADGREEGAP